jgi:hypothetical protein
MSEVNAYSFVDVLVRAHSGDNDALKRLLACHLPRLQRWSSGRLPMDVQTRTIRGW